MVETDRKHFYLDISNSIVDNKDIKEFPRVLRSKDILMNESSLGSSSPNSPTVLDKYDIHNNNNNNNNNKYDDNDNDNESVSTDSTVTTVLSYPSTKSSNVNIIEVDEELEINPIKLFQTDEIDSFNIIKQNADQQLLLVQSCNEIYNSTLTCFEKRSKLKSMNIDLKFLLNNCSFSFLDCWGLGYNLADIRYAGHLETIKAIKLIIKAEKEGLNCILDNRGNTPLRVSILANEYDMCKALLNRGCNVNERRLKDESTALFTACISNNIRLMKLLIDYKADVNHPDRNQIRPLHKCYSVEAMETLLDYGKADINAVDSFRNSALHMCCGKSMVQCALFLIERGASLHIKDRKRNNCFDLAQLGVEQGGGAEMLQVVDAMQARLAMNEEEGIRMGFFPASIFDSSFFKSGSLDSSMHGGSERKSRLEGYTNESNRIKIRENGYGTLTCNDAGCILM